MMYEDAHLEMAYETRYEYEDPSDYDFRDFDTEDEFFDGFDEEECAGHYDDDLALIYGNSIGEPYYCDGSCMS